VLKNWSASQRSYQLLSKKDYHKGVEISGMAFIFKRGLNRGRKLRRREGGVEANGYSVLKCDNLGRGLFHTEWGCKGIVGGGPF